MSEAGDTSPQPGKTGQPKAGDRRRARALAMQGLYQRHFSKTPISDIEAEFMVDNDMSKVDIMYFRDLLRGVYREQAELDKLLEPFLDRPLKEVDPVELAIVRLGAYELKHRIDVPYKVVINEAVALTKKFGATDGHKYINGVLDKAARQLRKVEIDAAS